MGILIKLEEFLNKLLTRLGGVILVFLKKLIPTKLVGVLSTLTSFSVKVWIIQHAKMVLPWILAKKTALLSLDIKGKLKSTYSTAMERYLAQGAAKGGRLKTILMAPVLVFGQWLQGLTTAQSVLLMTSTAASIIAVIGIGFSGQKLSKHHSDQDRAPASVELPDYARPDYYKQQRRFFSITNLRLPIYVAEVNEIRSVDIDFQATVSNRNSRALLEKFEFQLRDHLIHKIEPIIASFTLQEEGKVMIKEKLQAEINVFMKDRNFEGEIEDLKITYILAN
jgi:flagellar basal body-associated protein FliL